MDSNIQIYINRNIVKSLMFVDEKECRYTVVVVVVGEQLHKNVSSYCLYSVAASQNVIYNCCSVIRMILNIYF